MSVDGISQNSENRVFLLSVSKFFGSGAQFRFFVLVSLPQKPTHFIDLSRNVFRYFDPKTQVLHRSFSTLYPTLMKKSRCFLQNFILTAPLGSNIICLRGKILLQIRNVSRLEFEVCHGNDQGCGPIGRLFDFYGIKIPEWRQRPYRYSRTDSSSHCPA